MQLTAIFLLGVCLQLSAAGLSQNVTFSAEKVPLSSAFKAIEEQTGYVVVYYEKDLKDAKLVTIKASSLPLEEFLDQVLKGQDFGYVIKEKTIAIKRIKKLVGYLNTPLISPPPIKISGTVVGINNRPLAGATVMVKGKNISAVSDERGHFELNADLGSTFIISYVGFRQREYKINSTTPVTILLLQAESRMDTAKVILNTGYQTVPRERSAGSFYKIDNEMFNRSQGTNVLDRIDYLIPGLLAEIGSNKTPANYTIRGVTTFSANRSPLFVVDNFIYEGDPRLLNPNDVESITVLRDATAASIWGARAGNGVIVITTKKGGAAATPRISIGSLIEIVPKPNLHSMPSIPSKDIVNLEMERYKNGYFDGYLNNTSNFPMVTPVVEILEREKNELITPQQAQNELDKLRLHDIRDDIKKYLIQNEIVQQHNLSISGGASKFLYFGSLSYVNKRKQDVNSKNENMSLRFKNSWNPSTRISLNAEITWIQSNEATQNSIGSYFGLMSNAYLNLVDDEGNPVSIPYKYRKNYVDTVDFPGKEDWSYIPLDEARNGDGRSKVNEYRISGNINYEIISGLKLSAMYQFQRGVRNFRVIKSMEVFDTRDLINRFATIDANDFPVFPYPKGGIFSSGSGTTEAWDFRGQMNYSKSFKLHSVNLMGGYDVRQVNLDQVNTPLQYGFNERTNSFTPIMTGLWTERPTLFQALLFNPPVELTGNLSRFGSFYVNGSYNFDNRYTFNASVRIDQSNFFGVDANKRKRPFWSVGGGWNLANEKFYRIDWMPVLSLRTTFGYSGNIIPGASPYATAQYFPAAAPLFFPFAIIQTPPNPDLKWERTQQINIGIDFGFRSNRVGGSFDAFIKRGRDLINSVAADPTVGYLSYVGNRSSINTQGVELTLRSKIVDRQIKWNNIFIFSRIVNKVIRNTAAAPRFASSYVYGNGSLFIEDKPQGALYSFKWAGVNTEDGDAGLYVDGKVDGSSNADSVKMADLVYHGSIVPPVFGSMLNEIEYRQFSLSFNLSYRFSYYFRRVSFGGVLDTWGHKDYLDAWKKSGDEKNSNVPGFRDYYEDNRFGVYQLADILVERGDHIRLQDIKLSYNTGRAKIGKSVVFENIQVGLYINNVGIVWKKSKYNPDTQGGLVPPIPRIYSASVNISL